MTALTKGGRGQRMGVPGQAGSFVERWPQMMAIRPQAERRAVPWVSAGLARALRLVEDGLLRENGKTLCVPSAGAIFPYEVLTFVGDLRDEADSPQPPARALLRIDLARRAYVRLPVPPELLRLISAADDDEQAYLLLLTRPWLSMRKYGPRGYFYTQIDAGHAATNLLCAASTGGRGQLRLRLPRLRFQELIADVLPCRELHSAITVPSDGLEQPRRPWSAWLLPESAESYEYSLEAQCWAELPHDLADDGEIVPTAAAPVLAGAGALAEGGTVDPEPWVELARRRQSCKRFSGLMPPAGAVLSAISILTTELTTDLDPSAVQASGQIGLTVLAPPGLLSPIWPDDGPRLVETSRIDDRELIIESCMGQQHLGNARVFALVHTPTDRMLVAGQPQALRDTLFRAAAAGQLLYLGAARAEIAVTAIGGFDAQSWRQLAELPDGEEIVYLIALGCDEGDVDRLDRREVAYAHGE
jgi:hypothetical protein